MSGSPGPTRLDLRAKTVAVAWDRILRRKGAAIIGYSSELWTAAPGKSRRLDRVDWGDMESTELFAPTITAREVRYAFSDALKRRTVEFRRVRLKTGAKTKAPAPSNDVYSVALADPLMVFTTAGGPASQPCATGCAVFRTQ